MRKMIIDQIDPQISGAMNQAPCLTWGPGSLSPCAYLQPAPRRHRPWARLVIVTLAPIDIDTDADIDMDIDI